MLSAITQSKYYAMVDMSLKQIIIIIIIIMTIVQERKREKLGLPFAKKSNTLY